MTTYIPEENLPRLQERIAQLSKRAEKLGVEPPILTIGTHTDRDHPHIEGLVMRVFEVEIEGQAPVINGWHFVARIEHLPDGNVLYTAPDETQPTWARTVEPKCDHCQLARDRKDTFLVRRDGATEVRQVGSSCLKDFTGHADPHALAEMAEMIGALDAFANECEGYDPDAEPGGESLVGLEKYLTYVSLAVDTHGWVSRSNAFGPDLPTADAAISAMFSKKRDRPTPEQKHRDEAAAAIEWALGHFDPSDHDLNDYEWNVAQVVKLDAIRYKHIGIAASVIPAYRRELEQRLALEHSAGYVGEPKQRIQFDSLTVESVRTIESYYGASYLHTMHDPDGHVLVWFASNFQAKPGDVLTGKGTIKEHSEFRHVQQTVLTRCKFEVSE